MITMSMAMKTTMTMMMMICKYLIIQTKYRTFFEISFHFSVTYHNQIMQHRPVLPLPVKIVMVNRLLPMMMTIRYVDRLKRLTKISFSAIGCVIYDFFSNTFYTKKKQKQIRKFKKKIERIPLIGNNILVIKKTTFNKLRCQLIALYNSVLNKIV